MVQLTQTSLHNLNGFLGNSGDSIAAYQDAIATAQQVVIDYLANQTRPYSGVNPDELARILATRETCPEQGKQLREILNYTGETILNNSVVVSHPTCIAHLHCPPLIPALAAEVLIAASNQSMDSWDQSPAATLLEQQVINWLCQLFGYEQTSDGIFTSGGTQSNFMGLLLARDRYLRDRFNWSVQQQGLPPDASRLRILSSAVSHFTIRQAAALLGLGEQAVVPVETDSNYRLCPHALTHQLAQLDQQNLLPIALVGTVGTTDFGSIDPLLELAAIAQNHGLWFHIDAAYGGALIMSDRHRHKLTGIEFADSIAVDFHKLFYQPISCGAFLLKDRSEFNAIALHADYLNPQTNVEAGIPDLVTKSIQTSRRFDALKLFVSLQTLGRKGFANLIDTTIDLAVQTAQLIDAEPNLELVNHPTINAVVFRYCSQHPSSSNSINRQIRTTLMENGEAVLAQTQIGQQIYLKFTLLNPKTTVDNIRQLLHQIQHLCHQLELTGT
ncbi:MAG: aspartate aminotransferase family protein [Coleofasciculus sp. D1-CHI-01]|uniref:pyridoxal phosphate-dependent decarboxylase family protein n=1 Tax=Coleofasciculus sp. D1-CHI-01 TaxID=3068482 RepID=UPI0032F75267